MPDYAQLTMDDILLACLMLGPEHSSYSLLYCHYACVIHMHTSSQLLEKQKNALRVAASLDDAEENNCVQNLAKELVYVYEPGTQRGRAALDIIHGILERASFTGEDEEKLLLYKIIYRAMDILLPLVHESEKSFIREVLEMLVESSCDSESSENGRDDRNNSDEDGNTGEDDVSVELDQSTESAAHGM